MAERLIKGTSEVVNKIFSRILLLLRWESLSGKCRKLRTVATSNNRDHLTKSLLLLVCTTYIWVLFFAHIVFVVNRTFNATPTEGRGCNTTTAIIKWSCSDGYCQILTISLHEVPAVLQKP